MKPTKEQLMEEFRKLYVINDYEADAHANNVNIKNLPYEIEKWIAKALTTIQQETERELVEKIEGELAEVVQQYNEEFPPHMTAGMRKTPMSQREQYLMCQEAALKNVINSLTQEKEGK